MDSLVIGIQISLAHALPVLVFGQLYRSSRWLDLSLDAQLASAGVVFALTLMAGGSFLMGLVLGIFVALMVVAVLYVLTEWGNVSVEIASLLLAFAVFKSLELAVGESISLAGVEGRIHPWLRTRIVDADFFLAVILVVMFVIALELLFRSHLGLMYRALGDNANINLRWSRGATRAMVTLVAGGFVGLSGVIQVDREGGVFSGFHLGRVIDAFIAAELTRTIANRARIRAESSAGFRRKVLLGLAETPVTVQLLCGAIILGTISYMLIRFMHPAIPSLIETVLVILLLARFEPRKMFKFLRGHCETASRGLVVNGLTKSYGRYRHKVNVLNDVTFDCFPRVGIVVIVGDNGSGKSTFLKILAGIVTPDQGKATIDGEPSQRKCRFLGQDPVDSIAVNLTVRENLDLAVARSSQPNTFHRLSDNQAYEILERFTHSDALAYGLDRPACEFSGGQIQLLAVACAAADASATTLLADEPVKMLDTKHKRLVEQQLLEISNERLVIISSHDPRFDLAPPTDHYVICNRQIVKYDRKD